MVSLGFLCSCAKTTVSDPKGDLVGSLKGADVEGYLFSLNEYETQTTSSLTNNAVNSLVTFGKEDANLVLRYTRVKDKGTGAVNTYKSEVIKKAGSLTLAVTDLATGTVVDEKPFPAAGAACHPEEEFDSISDCINEFNCTDKGRFQCEADRTCDPQVVGLTCCLKNGQIFSVHLIINPDSFKCRFRDLLPDLEGMVLSAE